MKSTAPFVLALALLAAAPASAKEPTPDIDPSTGVYIQTDADVVIVSDSDEAEAVDPFDPQVLFGGRTNAQGGWGGIETALTSINGSAATLFGFRGGYMTGHRFTIGFAGVGIASHVDADPDLFKSNVSSVRAEDFGPGHYIEGGYGGLLLQWEPLPRWVIHPHVSATLGGGAATYSQRENEDGWDSSWDVSGDIETEEDRPATVFAIADLRAGGTLNMTRWARLDASLGYRHVGGMSEIDGLSRAELGGFSLGLGLRFGAF